MKLRYILYIIAVFILHGCKPVKSDNSVKRNYSAIPTEVFWELERLGAQERILPAENGNKIGFTLFDNTISGFAGCNEFGGTYEYGPNRSIQFSPMVATKMFCSDMQISESNFFKVFMDVFTFGIQENRLEFMDLDGTILAVFKKQFLSTDEITDKYWRLKLLQEDSVKMTGNQRREAYFKLNSNDNTVTGFTGCNTLFGSFNLGKKGSIYFSQMAATLMACPDIEIKEDEFLKVFELADSYMLNDDELTLKKDKDSILAVFEAVYFK